jgi:hypothetical protein
MIARRRKLKSPLLSETNNAAGIIAQCTEGKKLKFLRGLLPELRPALGETQPGSHFPG